MRNTTINKFDVGAEIAAAVGTAVFIFVAAIALGIWFLIDQMNSGSVGAYFVAGMLMTLLVLGFGWIIFLAIAWANEKIGSSRMKDNQQENERLLVLQHQMEKDKQAQLQNTLVAARIATEQHRAGNQAASADLTQQKALMAQITDLRKENEKLKSGQADNQEPAWGFSFDEADALEGDYYG